MVAWNCKNGGLVEGVGLIELVHVIFFFAESVNNVAKVKEERGLIGERRVLDLIGHVIGHVLLRAGIVRGPGIANHVKDDFPRLLHVRGAFGKNIGQIHSIWGVLALLIPVMIAPAHAIGFVCSCRSYALRKF